MRARRNAPLLVVSNESLFCADAGGAGRRDRLLAIHEAVEAAALPGVEWRVPAPASDEAIERVHDRAYLERLKVLRGLAPAAYAVRSVLPGSMAAVLLAAGACLDGVDALLEGRARRVFCAVEPPGHHAERARGMGFCAVNNVAVAARHALSRGCERVLVVDWDVHHGNGTEQALAGRGDAVVFDCHQRGLFPTTIPGAEERSAAGAANVFNVPLPEGMGDADYLAVFEELLVPLADRFRPDLVLVSAGFDAHRDDPLGGMNLTAEGFGALCSVVDGIATRNAGGKLLLSLEGGYKPAAVGESAGRVVAALSTGRAPRPVGEVSSACSEVIDALAARIRSFRRPPARRRASIFDQASRPGR